jgi:serine endopeptidase inhibitor I10-like protein
MSDKTKSPSPENSEQSRPFFARFLEGQEWSEVSKQTLKYPSDRDEWDQRIEYMPATEGN